MRAVSSFLSKKFSLRGHNLHYHERKRGNDGTMSQVRASAALCHLGTPPKSSTNAADNLRLRPMQSNLELRARSGNGGGLRRRIGSIGRSDLIGGAYSILCFDSGTSNKRLNQLQPFQAGVPFLTDDDVIVHGNAERLRHRNNLLRHLNIGARRRRIAGWMIVHQNHGSRR